MKKLLLFVVFLIVFTITMSENIDNKATVKFFGQVVFDNAPVLVIVLSSFLLGILVAFPLMWFKSSKVKSKEKARQQKKADKMATHISKGWFNLKKNPKSFTVNKEAASNSLQDR